MPTAAIKEASYNLCTIEKSYIQLELTQSPTIIDEGRDPELNAAWRLVYSNPKCHDFIDKDMFAETLCRQHGESRVTARSFWWYNNIYTCDLSMM